MEQLSLDGIIDMHMHSGPDLRPRRYDDLTLCSTAVEAGASAIVLKSHLGDTSARAYLANRYCQETYPGSSFQAVGSITLNRGVGGLNPEAVSNALTLGARVVWLPTASAENHLKRVGKPTDKAVRVIENGRILPALGEVMELIRQHDAVLATGHLSGEEIRIVVKAAREMGLRKIVVTHPEWWLVGLSLEEQCQLVRTYDVVLERCFAQNKGVGPGHGYLSNLPGNLEAIQTIGSQNILISTDGGQAENLPWPEMEREYLGYLLSHGVSREQLWHMSRTLPCNLLGL